MLTERVDRVKIETDDLCRQIREKRQLLQEQMEKLESTKKTIEKNALEVKEKLLI